MADWPIMDRCEQLLNVDLTGSFRTKGIYQKLFVPKPGTARF